MGFEPAQSVELAGTKAPAELLIKRPCEIACYVIFRNSLPTAGGSNINFHGATGCCEESLSHKVSNKTPALTAGIIGVLAVVLVNAAVSYRATALLAHNSHLVAHTLRVMNELLRFTHAQSPHNIFEPLSRSLSWTSNR